MQASPDQLDALQRLWQIANRDCGQSRTVAKFLLGLYNGMRFPFDLTDFRALDTDIFADCLTVLEMDNCPAQEVHQYIKDGGRRFEQLAIDWNVRDHSKQG